MTSKEALKQIEKETIIYDDEEHKSHYGTLGVERKNLVEIIEKDLERLEKQDKVLEIIKKKNVNIGLIKVVSEVKRYNQTYVIDNMLNVKWQLTEEEFNLLKEVLDNGK